MNDLISIKDLTQRELLELFRLADELKSRPKKYAGALAGKTLALLFQKPSNRTRVSFSVGMYQLGGNAIYLSPDEIALGVRESVHDVAKTLSRYVDGIVLRTFAHRNVIELAEHADVPVINGLSDYSHPCQALADIYTVREKLKKWKETVFAYVGDGNNVCNSLIFACAKLGIRMRVASPPGYEPDKDVVALSRELSGTRSEPVVVTNDPFEAVKGAGVVYTDVWASMGQEEQTRKRRDDFRNFQINARLMSTAAQGALVMHCLPAHRGEEITAEVIDGKHSVVFDEAENRMHVQKALLLKLLAPNTRRMR